MKKPDDKILAAMASLASSHDFTVFLGWLEEDRDIAQRKLNLERDNVALRILQGEVNKLNDILAKTRGARETIKTIKDKRQAEEEPE